MRKILALAICLTVFVACAGQVRAANWPQWRGPRLNGSSPETDLPTTFGPEKNVAWKKKLPGTGGSTPIVWEGRIFLSAQAEDKTTMAVCLSAEDGSVLWKRDVGEGYINRRLVTACTPSAVTDGDSVWFLYGNGDLVSFDMDGTELWRRDLAQDHGKWEVRWDYGSSPLLWNDNLYIQALHGDYKKKKYEEPHSYILCVDPATGEDLWKHMRQTDAEYEARQAYSTPIPLTRDDGDQILIAGGDHVTGHVASTGRELWRSPTTNPRKMKYYPIVASPAVAQGMVLVCAPRGDCLYAIKPNTSEWAWTQERTAGFSPTPATYRKRVYVLDEQRRRLHVVEPKTGEVLGQCDIPGRGMLHPSPTAADGKIYCMDTNGHVVVTTADKKPKVLHEVEFGGQKVRSTIVVSGGHLFIRTGDTLYCIGGDEE